MNCFKCDGSYQKKHGKFKFDDRYVGIIIVNDVDYYECSKCDDQLLPAETAGLIENKRKELLERYLEEQPIKEFLSAAETAASLNITRQALHKHQRIKKGFIYQTTFGGNRVYLKKSIDLYKKKGDGRFVITFSPKEKLADFRYDYALSSSVQTFLQYAVQRHKSLDYQESFTTKVKDRWDEWLDLIVDKKRGQEDIVKFHKSHDVSNIPKWSKPYVAKKSSQSYS